MRDAARMAGAWTVAVLTVAALAALGWVTPSLIDRDPAPSSDSPRDRMVTAGSFRVAVDRRWAPVAVPKWLAGTGLRDVRALALAPGAPTRAWIAATSGEAPAALPRALRGSVAGRLPRPEHVRLGGRPATVYHPVALENGQLSDIAIVAGSGGVLVLGCTAPSSWWPAVDGWRSGIRLISGGEATDRPSAERGALSRLISRLNRRRQAGRAALRTARDANDQATAAARIARAHTEAARRLAALGPGADGPLIRALRDAAGAYRALAEAARAQRPGRFERTAARAAGADRAVQRRLLEVARRAG